MTKLLTDLQKATMLAQPLNHDVKWVGAKNPDLCMSWSKLESFDACPRKFKHIYIDKLVAFDTQNPALVWGRRVHEAIEKHLLAGHDIPAEMYKMKPMIDAVTHHVQHLDTKGALRTPLNAEQDWAMTANGKYTTWFDTSEVFMRNKADAVYGGRSILFAVDWKTGKGKYPKPEQLEVVALTAKAQPTYAKYEKSRGMLVYVEANKTIPLEVDLSPTAHETLMHKYLKKGIAIVEAYESGEWAMKQSPLCGWCEDTTCPYNRRT